MLRLGFNGTALKMNHFLRLTPYKIRLFVDVIASVLLLYALASLYQSLETEHFLIISVVLIVAFFALLLSQFTLFQHNKKLFEQLTNKLQDSLEGSADAEHQPLNSADYSPVISHFIEQFNTLIAKSSANTGLFSDVASKLAVQASELSNVASGIETQMQGQADQTTQVRVIIEKLQETVSLAANVAGEVSDLANKSESEGNSGKVVMTDAITGVMTLATSVNEAGEIIHNLGEDSKSIGGIIDVITGVAEQTNLLALNAAIEAARAGEQGRGFAVVADEVRSLASQTQSSAQKINSIINTLLSHVDDASKVIKRTVEEADKSDELMEGVVMSYSEIVGYMSDVSRLSNELSQETLRGKGAAAGAAYQLSEITSLGSATMDKARILTASSMELGKMGEQLNLLLGVAGEVSSDNEDDTSDDVELF